jgi:methionyl aminopeptidase
MIYYKSASEIDKMKRPNQIVAEILVEIESVIKPGISTEELDRFAEKIINKRGARPAFKGYRDYPATLCTSVNEQVVHGIPSPKVLLEEGDIVSIDIGAECDGWFGDAAKTFPVGEITTEDKRLLTVTSECLESAVKVMTNGNRLSDIGNTIQSHAESNGFAVVRDYVGHGIGRQMHEQPQVPNYGNPGRGPYLRPGMVLAIEPMINIGTWETEVLEDGWTVVTADGKKSAHFEYTIAVTDSGPLVLSKV